MNKTNFVRAVAMLMGTIIGAGMFGIPYAVSKSGFIIGFLMILILGEGTILLNLAYGEVILRTKGKHQLTGYAGRYLGRKGRILALVSLLTGLYGGLIAYIIGVGRLIDFLIPLEAVTSPFFWSVLFFITLAFAVLIGLKLVSNLDTILSFMLVVAFLVLMMLVYPQIKLDYLSSYSSKLEDLFAPYGVILFSLGGASILAEVKSVLDDKRKYYQVILTGTLIPIILYFIFALVIVGVTGQATSDDAIRGLIAIKPVFAYSGAILGIISMTTSFLGLSTILKDMFNQDFKIPYFWAWVLSVFPPFIIFCLGLQSFFLVISVTGAIMAGIEGIIIILMHKKAKEKGQQVPVYTINIPRLLQYYLILIFILGIGYEIYTQLF